MEMQYIFLAVFAVVSAVYMTTLAFKPSLLQFVLKGLLMPLVLCIYISGAGGIFWPIVLALIFAWIGDVLLLKITNILWFKLGLASFLVGHLFYIIAMSGYILPPNVPVLVISTVVASAFMVVVYKVTKPGKPMRVPVIAYEFIIMLMFLSALQLVLVQNNVFGILVFIGSICFVASDTMLALRTFRKVKIYFAVMATYIAAQLFITLGFCALG
ncbi:MAG: lysoplasmalogenase [Treponema sp.]|nr:lysoplasmalogenase [Treponema sp.]